jgi:hypothetical protein
MRPCPTRPEHAPEPQGLSPFPPSPHSAQHRQCLVCLTRRIRDPEREAPVQGLQTLRVDPSPATARSIIRRHRRSTGRASPARKSLVQQAPTHTRTAHACNKYKCDQHKRDARPSTQPAQNVGRRGGTAHVGRAPPPLPPPPDPSASKRPWSKRAGSAGRPARVRRCSATTISRVSDLYLRV